MENSFKELYLEITKLKDINKQLNKYKSNPNYLNSREKSLNNINRKIIFISNLIVDKESKLFQIVAELNKEINYLIKNINNYENAMVAFKKIELSWPLLEVEINKTKEAKILEDIYNFSNLHPEITTVSKDLFKNGHYAQAIEEAFKRIVILVKVKSGKNNLDGSSLMTEVFSKNAPTLKFNQLRDRTEQDEQEGWMHLYLGAVLGIRNVKAHSNIIQKDKNKAFEYLAFASLLCKRLDETI